MAYMYQKLPNLFNENNKEILMNTKQLFDWIRKNQKNNKLTQSEVDVINQLLVHTSATTIKQFLTEVADWKDTNWQTNTMMQLSLKGSNFINEFESYVSKPYKDMVGVWTIGYGNTYYEDGSPVRPTDKPISKTRALELKHNILNQDFIPAINMLLMDQIRQGNITQNMFDAITSLAYNIGIKRFTQSSILTVLQSGDFKTAANKFKLYNKARVKGVLNPVRGLTRRREAEKEMFLS